MKHFPFLLSVLLSFNLLAQDNTFLFEISGKDVHTSWLYGTIHLQDDRVFEFGDSVMAKFDKAAAYACEVKMSDVMFAALALIIEKDSNKWIRNNLSEEDYKRVSKVLVDYMGFAMAQMADQMKPIMIATELLMSKTRKDHLFPMDIEFENTAKKANKKVIGLETASDQLKYLDDIPYEQQLKWLMHCVDSMNLYLDLLEEMIEFYRTQRVKKLLFVMAESEKQEGEWYREWDEKMMRERNAVQLEGIIREIKLQPTFTAVGAAHLYGVLGLIKLLRDKGYKVSPIYSNHTPRLRTVFKLKWQKLKSKEGDFSIQMPGKAELKEYPFENDGKEEVTYMYRYQHPDPSCIFSVTYFDLDAASLANTDNYWEQTITKWKSKYSQLQDFRELDYRGAKGKAFYTMLMGNFVEIRALIHKERIYMLFFGGPAKLRGHEEFKFFENSLKLH